MPQAESAAHGTPLHAKILRSMDAARIASLLEPFIPHPLSEAQLDHISMYIDLLLRWNARINLTAIRNEDEIVTRHFGESLFMASHLFPEAGQTKETGRNLKAGQAAPRVVDIGSGAGFPAIPLKLWAPHIDLTLIESSHKKAAFLREIGRAVILTDINVMAERAESLAEDPIFPRADFVTFRAVERFESILPSAIRLLKPDATLAILISTAQLPHLPPGPKWNNPIAIPMSQSRVLSVGKALPQ